MLDSKEALKILNSYNIASNKYGPTLYENGNEIGICLELKDSVFGFLTRIFTFKSSEELEIFLKKYYWYKNNNKYNIELSLESYDKPITNIIYKYNNKELSFEDMLNLDKIIEEQKKIEEQNSEKNIYITNIKGLTNYLIELNKQKEININIKNELKTKENDLKYELLELLTKYYGKDKKIEKKQILLESSYNVDYTRKDNKELESKTYEELKKELTNLINIIKLEELDEKNLIAIYSNNIYKYNIDILNKQIEFVKSKIEAEKNFNIKGSKIHNIDEELKSFLKNNNTPIKLEDFLKENKTKVEEKHNKIIDIKNSYSIISGNKIDLPTIKYEIITNKIDTLHELDSKFDSLAEETKALLTLYNSIYKNICNYIINNKYPNIDIIKNAFDFNYLYNELEETIYNENNNHYLNKYFKYIDFKNLETYINSLINICKIVENTNFIINNKLKTFYIEEKNKYKTLSINPIYKNNTYIIELQNNNILYIPDKIILNEETKEFSIMASKNIYINGEILESFDTIKVNKYSKSDERKDGIITTNRLNLKKEIIFNIGTITGEKHE